MFHIKKWLSVLSFDIAEIFSEMSLILGWTLSLITERNIDYPECCTQRHRSQSIVKLKIGPWLKLISINIKGHRWASGEIVVCWDVLLPSRCHLPVCADVIFMLIPTQISVWMMINVVAILAYLIIHINILIFAPGRQPDTLIKLPLLLSSSVQTGR